MVEEQPKSSDLEQLLRDERALRIRAENRASAQAEKAQVWRSRAEERAARIERLEDETKSRRRRRRRRQAQVTPPTPAPPRLEIERPVSRMASIRVATAVLPDQEITLSSFASEATATTRSGLAEAELVVVDASVVQRLSAEQRRDFDEWLALPARQPLVVFAEARTDERILRGADLVVGPERDVAALQARGANAASLNPTFDPAAHNPIGRTYEALGDVDVEQRTGGTALLASGVVVAVENADLAQPADWLVQAAASGVPVTTSVLDRSDPNALAKAGAAARRWAYRNHTPGIRAVEIASRVGISARNPQPSAAAILVSMRPDLVAARLDMIRQQTYRNLRIVVGLHGKTATPELEQKIAEVRESCSLTLVDLSENLTLGECLNHAIDTCGAEILAKIDDDDYYGPAHFEDGIQALEYSGAGIVGKGAQFTYVEEIDRTVLRRHREEESFVAGYVTGATMFVRRSVWEQSGFPHRPRQVDVLLTRAARYNGAKVYGNSRWEFCYVRQAGGHTWTTQPDTFTSGASQDWEGFDSTRVVAPDLIR